MPDTRVFQDMLGGMWAQRRYVCVGLDSDLRRIPMCARVESITSSICDNFNIPIVNATMNIAAAYKLNLAFYIQHGAEGINTLRETIRYIQAKSRVPVILDGKFGDIGNTNNGYVNFAFEECQADAVTVQPYLGWQSLAPFLACTDKGIFVLCRTSNPGAGEFQDLREDCTERPFYQIVASNVSGNWNSNNNCGLVVGATYPTEVGNVRRLADDGTPLLIPGIGAQGGDLEKTVKAARNSRGDGGFIINSSRGIIFASSGEDFAEAAQREAQKLNDQIVEILNIKTARDAYEERNSGRE